MILKDILAISGEPGLFRFIAQGKNAIIVEHLETKKRRSAYGSAKVSSLEDIAIFTETGEVHFKKVLRTIFEKEEGKQLALNAKSSNEELKTFFEEIVPEYDREKVYVSDIKKVVLWYNLLVEKGLVDLEEDKVEEKTEEPVVEELKSEQNDEAEIIKEKPVKKAAKRSPKKADKNEEN